MTIDFNYVRAMLKDAVRTSFDALRASHPQQTFYAFALSDSDGTGPSPAANSEQKWLKRVEREKLADSDERFLYRWSPAEWAFEAVGCEPFHPVWQILRSEQPHDRLAFKARSFGASIYALKELSDEGYFGSGDRRVTVFFSLSDDENSVWLERESARRANPPEVFAAFESEWRIAAVQQYGSVAFKGGDLVRQFVNLFGSG